MSSVVPRPEFWLRGPVEGVPPVLMPAVHALLQTLEDAEQATADLTVEQLWQTPGGAASIGFHLLHLSGATDRLLTYARGETLNTAQKSVLSAEKNPPRTDIATLLTNLRRTIDLALTQIRATPPDSVLDVRAVGRAGLPTTVLGLIFHAGEHAQRHAGQLVTTAKIVRA
jgi:hypothetical protein